VMLMAKVWLSAKNLAMPSLALAREFTFTRSGDRLRLAS
jgi:hypothetical protein